MIPSVKMRLKACLARFSSFAIMTICLREDTVRSILDAEDVNM